MTKEIKLTQGKVAIVDDEYFERLNVFKWYANRRNRIWYAQRSCSIGNGKQTTICMHRVIMDTPKHMKVDHRNGDGLFNCKKNLRICTHQENKFNQQSQKNNRLGIKGVCWREDRKKYQAQIKINGKPIYLGLFNISGDADSAYRIAEEKYFGAFTRMGCRNWVG